MKTPRPSHRDLKIVLANFHQNRLRQGSHGHGKSWKTMENEKIKSRPGKVMKNENLAKSHGISNFHKCLAFLLGINVLVTYIFDTQ